MRSIDDDISTGQLKQIYLLYGCENYLKEQYRDKLVTAFVPDGDTMNIRRYNGKDISVGDIIDDAETLPFFAERKVIVLENSGFFKNAIPEFTDYLEHVPEGAAFVFMESEIDKRSKAYKTTAKNGRAEEFNLQGDDVLVKWIGIRASHEGRKIRRSDAQHLIDRCGMDMSNLSMELEKLFAYTYGHDSIATEDIDSICTVQVTSRIFDMVDAVAAQDPPKAISLYHDLLELREPPMRILFLISRQFRLMAHVRSLYSAGKSSADIAKNAGIPSFAVQKYLRGAERFGMMRLREAMTECASLEEAVKTGRMTDQISVELLIVKYSRRI